MAYDTSKLRTAPFIGPKAALAMTQAPMASKVPTRAATTVMPSREAPPKAAQAARSSLLASPAARNTSAAMQGAASSGVRPNIPAGGVPSTMMKKGGKAKSVDGIAKRGKTRAKLKGK